MFRKIFNRLSKKYSADKDLNSTLTDNLSALQKSLGIKIKDHSIYIKALTHSSFLDIHPELQKSNERLEFLGDSVLSMIVGKYLFKKYPLEEEGFLTKTRSMLVNRESLANAAEQIGLHKSLLYNQKYLRDSIEGKQTILSDAFEAVIGAVYLDLGIRETEKVVSHSLIKPREKDETILIDTNYKGQLLEFCHSKKISVPRYVVKNEDGPPHNKKFTIEVYIGEELVGLGTGKNKKSAEQEASKYALQKLKPSS